MDGGNGSVHFLRDIIAVAVHYKVEGVGVGEEGGCGRSGRGGVGGETGAASRFSSRKLPVYIYTLEPILRGGSFVHFVCLKIERILARF